MKSKCLDILNRLSQEDQDAINERIDQYRTTLHDGDIGSRAQMAKNAVNDHLADLKAERSEMLKQVEPEATAKIGLGREDFAARQEKQDAIVAEVKRRLEADGVVVGDFPNGNGHIALTRAVDGSDHPYRVTTFDKEGQPSGHREYDTIDGPSINAAASEFQSGVKLRDVAKPEQSGASADDSEREHVPFARTKKSLASELGGAKRFEIGASLTKEQRRTTLASLKDAYRLHGLKKELVGLDRNGNERYAYPYSPELFEKSDITGAMVRYYVQLPDGQLAHPSELFPEVDGAYIKRKIDEQIFEEQERQRRSKDEDRQAIALAKDSPGAARAYWQSKSDNSLRTTGNKPTILPPAERVMLAKGGRYYMAPSPAVAPGWQYDLDNLKSQGWRDVDESTPIEPKATKQNDDPAWLSSLMGDSRPALELKGETEAEIKQRETLQAKADAEKKAKDIAPSPEGFTLTGSDRPADVAEAHGQKGLFAREKTVFDAEKMERLRREIMDGVDTVGAQYKELAKMRKLARKPEHFERIKEREESAADSERALAKLRREYDAQERASREIAPLNDERRQESLFKRGQKSESLPISQVQTIADSVAKNWTNAPEIHVIASMEEAPKAVREENDAQLAQGAEGAPYAFYHDGAVYLVASEAKSVRQVVTGLFHESLGHYGLRGVFGEDLKPILSQLAASRRKDVEAKAKEYGLDMENANDRLIAAEEVLAELAQTRPEISFVQRALAIIRGILRKAGLDIELSDAELIRNFIEPARAFVEKGYHKSAMQGTSFHRAYHGSPHDFDRFDIHKIGSGEGAQAYGYGLYFAGKKEVAEFYKERLSYANILLRDRPVNTNSVERVAKEIYGNDKDASLASHILYLLQTGHHFDDVERIFQSHQDGPRALKILAEMDQLSRDDHGKIIMRISGVRRFDLKTEDSIGLSKLEHDVNYHARKGAADPVAAAVSEMRSALTNIKANNARDEIELAKAKERAKTMSSDDPHAEDNGKVQKLLQSSLRDGKWFLDEYESALRMAERAKPITLPKAGRLYEVELTPKEHEYLDWDKTYDEQSPQVKKALEKVGIFEEDYAGTEETGQSIYHKLGFGTVHDGPYGGDRAASELLAKNGIPGIKFLDGSSRGKGDGSHNYVLFSDKDVEVKAKFARTAPEWISEGSPALKSAAGKIDTYAPDKPIGDKIKGFAANWQERLVQGIVDAYAPLKRLGWTEYVKARMVKSADGALEGMMLYGKPQMNEDGSIRGELDRKGFLGAMKELKGEHDRFFMWIAGNRAERLAGEGREHLFSNDEIAAMKDLASGKMEDGTPRPQAYAKAAQTLKEYNKAILDIAEKTGLIDAESRHLWEHDFYVPFFRVGDDMKIEGPATKVKGLVRQQAFKKLTGGQENLGDLMENTLRNWSHLLSASLANQAAVANLKAAEKLGIASEVPADTKGATYAMVDGKKVHYQVDDPFILTAISAMESAQFKGLPMAIMGKFKHYLTMGVTSSPTFRIRNLLRDSLSAIGQNDMSYNVLSNVAKGFKGTDRKSDDYAQMMFNGALMRFGQLTDGKHAEHAKRLIAAGVDDSTILSNPEKVKAALGKMWDEWQEFGDKMENINRSALYQKLRAEGKSDMEAAFAARDMMDFSLHGSWTAIRFLSQIVPFQNARLQGLYKMGRAAKEDPARLGYVTGAVALASIALLLAFKDDDDWKKREDFDRDTYWWFKIGDTAFRIPKPFEIGAIGTLAERSVELAISDEMTGKRFAQRLQYMLGQTFSMNPTPQLFKPMLDIYANVDSFTGRQIETRGMENLSKSERLNPETSIAAKFLGKAADVTNLSPVQVDHLVRAYFGWLGSHVTMTADMMAQPFMDHQQPSRKLGDYLVVGDFVKDLPADQSRYVEQFYKQAQEIHQVMGDLRQAREAHDLERVKEILEDKKSDIALSKLYTSAETRLKEINKQIRQVHNSDGSAEEKRAQLDRLTTIRNELARVVDENARTRVAAAQ